MTLIIVFWQKGKLWHNTIEAAVNINKKDINPPTLTVDPSSPPVAENSIYTVAHINIYMNIVEIRNTEKK